MRQRSAADSNVRDSTTHINRDTITISHRNSGFKRKTCATQRLLGVLQ